jgi:hypothetical protein
MVAPLRICDRHGGLPVEAAQSAFKQPDRARHVLGGAIALWPSLPSSSGNRLLMSETSAIPKVRTRSWQPLSR